MSSDGPVLQHVLAGQHENHVTACMQVTEVGGTGGDTGVLTVGEDKVLLVWLLRDNGEYYPSARKDLPSVGRSLSFDQDANRIYAGMDNGQIIVRPHTHPTLIHRVALSLYRARALFLLLVLVLSCRASVHAGGLGGSCVALRRGRRRKEAKTHQDNQNLSPVFFDARKFRPPLHALPPLHAV